MKLKVKFEVPEKAKDFWEGNKLAISNACVLAGAGALALCSYSLGYKNGRSEVFEQMGLGSDIQILVGSITNENLAAIPEDWEERWKRNNIQDGLIGELFNQKEESA